MSLRRAACCIVFYRKTGLLDFCRKVEILLDKTIVL